MSRDSYVEVVYAAGSETRVSDEGEGGVEAHLASILLTKAGGLSRLYFSFSNDVGKSPLLFLLKRCWKVGVHDFVIRDNRVLG